MESQREMEGDKKDVDTEDTNKALSFLKFTPTVAVFKPDLLSLHLTVSLIYN